MIRVLLADDDYLVKDVLQSMIPWEELGMEMIGFAEDGKQTLELCLEQKPDLLITDIRMPLLSGLEVALCLREQNQKTRVVLISGIQDFDYARTALDVQADGYLLKPIRLKEIIATLKKVRESIELESNRAAFLDKIETRLRENLPLARATFLHNLLHGTLDQEEALQEKLEYFELPFQSEETVVAAIGVLDNYGELLSSRSESQVQMVNFAVRDIMERTMDNYQAGLSFATRDNEFVLLFHREYCIPDKMAGILEAIAGLIGELDCLSISFGIGLPASGVRLACNSYNEARRALEHKFFVGNQAIIQIDDITVPTTHRTVLNEDESFRLQTLARQLLQYVKSGDTALIAGTLNDYLLILTGPGSLSREYIRGQFFELVIHAYREFCETEQELPDMAARYSAATQAILKAETVAEIRRFTQDILLAIAKHFARKYQNRHLLLVEQIKTYIQEHRTENITLNDISSAVYMSTNYICGVFKKECGQTIHDYLLDVKMQEGKRMLRETTMKVFEISDALGYETAHYFSYSFKRYTGKTPYQYRKEASPFSFLTEL